MWREGEVGGGGEFVVVEAFITLIVYKYGGR
jgi:hypothetical protein